MLPPHFAVHSSQLKISPLEQVKTCHPTTALPAHAAHLPGTHTHMAYVKVPEGTRRPCLPSTVRPAALMHQSVALMDTPTFMQRSSRRSHATVIAPRCPVPAALQPLLLPTTDHRTTKDGVPHHHKAIYTGRILAKTQYNTSTWHGNPSIPVCAFPLGLSTCTSLTSSPLSVWWVITQDYLLLINASMRQGTHTPHLFALDITICMTPVNPWPPDLHMLSPAQQQQRQQQGQSGGRQQRWQSHCSMTKALTGCHTCSCLLLATVCSRRLPQFAS